MRRGRNGDRARGASWQIGYAGFMTAMTALFILLWIISSGDETRVAVAAHFQYPDVGAVRDADRVYDYAGGRGFSSSQEKQDFIESAGLIQKAIAANPVLSDAMGRLSIQFVSQGLRIQLHDSPGESSVFEAGSAEPGNETWAILEEVGKILAPLRNGIVIEGHTNRKPFAGRVGYGKWELSSDRANSARRILEHAGVNSERILRVIGCADRSPAVPEDPLDPRNRRVSIIICHHEVEPY